jgi:hypothetical protein
VEESIIVLFCYNKNVGEAPVLSFSRCALIHRICFHIIIDHFAVLLLLTLNVIERLTAFFVGKFKDAGVIQRRNVLFCTENVAA